MKKTLIQNGNIVLEDQVIQGDLLIENGKIAQISDSPIDTDGCEVIQAAGKMILPGMIDTHAHLSDPGPYNYREDWLCASKSAASGGITTIVDMPLPSISVLDKERFDMKREVAEAHSVVDFALWGGACPKNIDKIEELDEAGCVGYKSFMCFATDEYPQMTDGYMVEALKKLHRSDSLLAVHAENAEVAQMGCDRLSAEHCEDYARFDEARPWWVELEAIRRATFFAKTLDARMMVCHMTIPEGGAYLKQLKNEGARVYVETCPHYLIFDHSILNDKKSFAKCTPPFRNRERVDELWSYVKDGTIDVIGTDHGPFTDEEKVMKNDFWKEYCGFGCNDVAMAAMITEGVHKRGLSWNRLASITSGNAARMFQIYPQKGNLLPGADADIQIIDPDCEWVYDGRNSFSKTKSSLGVYQDMKLKGKITDTFVRGIHVYQNGEILSENHGGQLIKPIRKD